MKIKLDKRGWLLLERGAGVMKEVHCPWAQVPIGYELPHCGDWCALFRVDSGPKVAEVFLCDTEHFCEADDFTDERGGE
jgi:hypothetical protein